MPEITRKQIIDTIRQYAICVMVEPSSDGPELDDAANALLALLAAREREHAGDHESAFASLADCVNTALRECERGGAQIASWTPEHIKGAINELVYANTRIRQERDALRAQVAALTTERDVLRGELASGFRLSVVEYAAMRAEIATLRTALAAAQGEGERAREIAREMISGVELLAPRADRLVAEVEAACPPGVMTKRWVDDIRTFARSLLAIAADRKAALAPPAPGGTTGDPT